MRAIALFRTKPNPIGKDSSWGYPIPQQLLGEWVDIRSSGDEAVNLSGISLAHQQYNQWGAPTSIEVYWHGSASWFLQPGEVLRVHTGRTQDHQHMAQVDRDGANYHAFAERGTFVLNNRWGDKLTILLNGDNYDACSYGPNPPEGAILVRQANMFVPAAAYAYSR